MYIRQPAVRDYLNSLNYSKPDILIIEIEMPRLNGLDMIKEVKRRIRIDLGVKRFLDPSHLLLAVS
jgi:two-component SAPR family response regulator